MLVGEAGSSKASSESKKISRLVTNLGFGGVEGDVAGLTDLEELFPGVAELLVGVGIAQPIVDVV